MDCLWSRPLELFWNDSVLQLARYPNSAASLWAKVVDTGSVPRVGDYSNRPAHSTTRTRSTPAGPPPGHLVPGFFHHGFADDKILVSAIDTRGNWYGLHRPHVRTGKRRELQPLRGAEPA